MKKLATRLAFLLVPVSVNPPLPMLALTTPAAVKPAAVKMDAHTLFSLRMKRTAQKYLLELQIENAGARWLTITLTDPEGNEHDHYIVSKHKEKAVRVYDFSIAPEGFYILKVTDGSYVQIKRLYVQGPDGAAHGEVVIEGE